MASAWGILASVVQSSLSECESGGSSMEGLPQSVIHKVGSLGYDLQQFVEALLQSPECPWNTYEDLKQSVDPLLRSPEGELGTHEDLGQFVKALVQARDCELDTRVQRPSTNSERYCSVSSTNLIQGFHFQNMSTCTEGYFTQGEAHMRPLSPGKLPRSDPFIQTTLSSGEAENFTMRTGSLRHMRTTSGKSSLEGNDGVQLPASSQGRKRQSGGFTIESCFTAATGALLIAPFDHSGATLILAIIAIAGGMLGVCYKVSKGRKVVEYFRRAFEKWKKQKKRK